jgi:hypothetical protein
VTGKCEDKLDCQKDGNIRSNPVEVFAEKVDAAGVKELYGKRAKECGENDNAIGTRGQ